MKEKVIICDIDGTIAIKGDRGIFDYSKVNLDTVNRPIFQILKSLSKDDINIIFCSGREDSCGEQTTEWLEDNVLGKFNKKLFRLLMRKTGDFRKDSIIKKEIYHEYIENQYEVLFVLDDRNQVVDMWRSLRITCLQVAKGDF